MSARDLAAQWAAAWPEALAAWSPYTRLRPPLLLASSKAAQAEGLTGSFAMIRLVDQTVVIDLEQVRGLGLEAYAVEVLAHEIGHHVYAPASVTEHTRSLARMLPALPSVHQHAPLIANLYTDLLINDRLQRSAGLRMAELMSKVVAGNRDGGGSKLWTLYLRIYELLWGLEPGQLTGKAPLPPELDTDARLAARLVRHYSRHWLDGIGSFALLVLPLLMEDQNAQKAFAALMDTRHAGLGGQADGLTEIEADERREIRHPGADPELIGIGEEAGAKGEAAGTPEAASRPASGQARDPFQYGELLRLAGIAVDPASAAIRYYRERAQPHLVPFPSLPGATGEDPLPEGIDPWEPGEPLERIDWQASLALSPRPIPGLTTVQRQIGTQPGTEATRRPLDLDLYVDSSGSMPDPRSALSWPALAGAVICLSALRAGAAVQVTLWSGRDQATTTPGFVRSADQCLAVLVGYYGGATQFPLPTLRDTHTARVKLGRPTHILVVSDDGASTMFDSPDERGTGGFEVCARALAQAGGGGTLALNIMGDWERYAARYPAWQWLRRARDEQGWAIHPVATLPDLLAFARAFARRHYGTDRVVL